MLSWSDNNSVHVRQIFISNVRLWFSHFKLQQWQLHHLQQTLIPAHLLLMRPLTLQWWSPNQQQCHHHAVNSVETTRNFVLMLLFVTTFRHIAECWSHLKKNGWQIFILLLIKVSLFNLFCRVLTVLMSTKIWLYDKWFGLQISSVWPSAKIWT